MTTLLMVALVIFGIFGYVDLPVSELPNVDFPTIQVNASLPGADPLTMGSAVAAPLENAFANIPGIDSMTSSSSLGSTNITIQFSLDRNIDGAAQDVQSAISTATSQLPRSMPYPPTFSKVNPTQQAILFLQLSSDTLPIATVDQYAESMLARQLSTLDGVAQIQVTGGAKYAVRIQADPAKLAARGIGIDKLASAAAAANVNQATGDLNSATDAAIIHTGGQLDTAAAFRNQIIAYSNGGAVRMGDVANVIDSVDNLRNGGWYLDKPSIQLAVQRQPGANAIDVVNRVKAVLPSVPSHSAPQRQSCDPSRSQRNHPRLGPQCARNAVDCRRAGSGRDLPVPAPGLGNHHSGAGIAHRGGRHICGHDGVRIQSRQAFADGADPVGSVSWSMTPLSCWKILSCHIEMGEKPYAAAMAGSREIGFTILSMTVSLAAVFIPLVFMSGVVGRLLHEFAVTIILAIIFSGVVSVTLTPMLCARVLKNEHGVKHNAFYRWSEHSFNRLQKGYEDSLNWSLNHKRTILAIFFASLATSILLFKIMPQDFLPPDDTSQLKAAVQAANGTSYERMVAYANKVGAIINKDPYVAGAIVKVGSSGAGANSADLTIMLKPLEERPFSAQQMTGRLRREIGNITGVNVFVTNPPLIRIGGRQSRSSYQYTLSGLDVKELQDASEQLLRKLQTMPGFTGLNSDFDRPMPSVEVAIDRDRAATLGVSPSQIETAMGYAFGGQRISQIYAASDQYQVMLELLPQYQSNVASLRSLYITSSNGTLVPLSAVTKAVSSVMPLSVNHVGEVPAITISFDMLDGYALSDAVTMIDQASRAVGIPPTIQGSFQGTAGAFRDATSNMSVLLLIAIITVYIILGILYESFIHPLTILSGLPSAATGALITLYIVGLPLTLYAFVGMIMLIGIVKKNAIMMIDFALHEQRSDRAVGPEEAIRAAAVIRFRPIMMTTMAALMGTLPIAFGSGMGADGRRPLGVCVAGGLLLSQLLTLYITPVIYTYLDHLGMRVRGFRWGRKPSPLPAE